MLDPGGEGVHGADEQAAFAALPPFSGDQAARLCRLVLMQALPGLADRDIAAFGAAIKELQAVLGDHYAPLQGGRRFASPAVAACLDRMDRAGAHGIGQSSWGPTGFAFAASPLEAERLAAMARRDEGSAGLDILLCAGLNHGAEIASAAAEAPRQQ